MGLLALSNGPAWAGTTYSPINNDCSGGYVDFTFDDGPGVNTPAVLQALEGLNLKATFFVIGDKLPGNPANDQAIQAEVANGFSVQNHTYDHASWTGASTGTAPLTDSQIQAELTDASQAIVNAGAPMPTLYRPPYGDISTYDDLLAQHLGYRVVMPFGTPTTGNIVDSRDWTGISPSQIASNVINGYTLNGNFYPGIKADSIIAMHDGLSQATLNTVQALQPIVTYMNSQHLCSTSVIRPDATGGILPPPAPPEPTAGNLVDNPSLETLRPGGSTEPACFQQAGSSVASNAATWSLTSDVHSGSVAESVTVTNWTAGDRKLVLSQRASEASCLPAVTPGHTYSLWVWYKGSWPSSGSNPSKVSITTYYKNSSGAWTYWQGSPLVPQTSFWNLAYFVTAPLPAGATAISYGLAISGLGTLTTDDYAMIMN